jgi:hypothetical protein
VHAGHFLYSGWFSFLGKKCEQFLGEFQGLLQFYSVALLGLVSVVDECLLFIFFDDLFHDRTCTLHEAFKLKSFIFSSFLSLEASFILVVVSHSIFRSLIIFILLTRIFSLHLPGNILIARVHNGSLDRASRQLGEVHILWRLWDQLK